MIQAEAGDPPASQALIRRAQAGDRQAFAELVASHQSGLRRQLRQLTRGDAALADDLAQDCLLQVWRSLPQFRLEARFSTWLHRIAYHRFLVQARRLALPAAGAGPTPHGLADDPPEAEGIIEPDGLTQEEQGALRLDVARALDQLPEAERHALLHCYHLDLSHEEAADVLGLPLGTLKSHVSRGKARLRVLLAAWAPETTP